MTAPRARLVAATVALGVFAGAFGFACGGALDEHPVLDASGNPVGDASPVLQPDASIAGVTHDGWTWVDGPAHVDLFGAWGSSASDLWFVGAAGLTLHFDGHGFSAPDTGSSAELRGVWGSSASDVWAVGRTNWGSGDAEILHFDGGSWSIAKTIPGAELLGVAGSAANDVWAVGGKGLTLHFDGSAWTTVPSDPANDLSGVFASGGEAWAVGSNPSLANGGAVLRWNGAAWSSVAMPATQTVFSGVWGSSPSDLWFAGADQVDANGPGPDPSGILAHWNGSAFDATRILPAYATPLRAVFGSSPSDAKAVGSASAALAFDGSSWSSRTLPGDFEAVWQSAPNDVWAVGLGGVMAHFDGTDWTELVPPPPAFGIYTGVAVWTNSTTDAWAIGNGATEVEIRHWDGQSWTSSSIPGTSSAWLSVAGLWGTSAKDMWAVGSGPNPQSARIVHFDGTAWSDAYDVPKNYGFRGVWGSGPSDVWFGADDTLLVHWDGSKMTTVPVPGTASDGLTAIGGSSASDVWLVGNTNTDLTIRHFDGTSWSVAATGAGFASGVWASSPSDAWIVGWEGTAMHWDGASWSDASSLMPREVGAVWGSGKDDVWMVGWFGAVVHVVGGVATEVPVTSASLVGVSGSSAADVWMLTQAGSLLHHP